MGRKVIKIIFLVGLGIFLLQGILVSAFLAKPTLLLNERVLQWGVRKLATMGVRIEWSDHDFDVQSHSFLEKHLSFGANDVCVHLTDVSFCAKKLSLRTGFKFRFGIPHLTFVGPIDVAGGSITVPYQKPVRAVASSKAADKVEPSYLPFPFPESVPSWIKSADFKGVYVEVPTIVIEQEKGAIKGNALATGAPYKNGSTWNVQYQIAGSGKDALSSEGILKATSLLSLWAGPWATDLDAKVKLDASTKAVAKLKGSQPNPFRFDFVFNSNLEAAHKKTAKLDIQGDLSAKSLSLKINGSLHEWNKFIPQAEVNDCNVSLKKDAKGERAKFSFNCPVGVETRAPKAKGIPALKFSERSEVLVTADLNTPFPPDSTGKITGPLRIDLSHLKNSFVTGKGGVDFKVDGILESFPDKLNVKTQIDTGLQIESFEDLVKVMSHFPAYAVPEPFRSLKGTIAVDAKGDGNLPWEIEAFPIVVTTRLKSSQQSFDIDSTGSFSLHKENESTRVHLDADTQLSDIRLVLPYMSLTSHPRLIADSRIRVPKANDKDEEDEASSSFSYKLRFHSPPPKPIRLVSNLASADVPIQIDLTLDSTAPVNVQLAVQTFPLQLFKRDAKVEHFNLRTSAENQTIFVDGMVNVTYTDYVVHIRVLGTADHPSIDLTSTPSLPSNQVVAVLLFGHTMDQLEPGQMESVGSARAAIADSAISLASMYLLASTPVESIGYDPSTGVVQAKLRLGDGTSLNVGSDLTQVTQLGVRKRLNANWSVSTYLDNPFESVTRALNAYLEWNKSY